jgi:hypothetical protein
MILVGGQFRVVFTIVPMRNRRYIQEGKDQVFVNVSVRVFKTGIFIIRKIDKEGVIIKGVGGVVEISSPVL